MSLFFSFRKPAPPRPDLDAQNALIASGLDMAALLIMPDGRDFSCVCGKVDNPQNPNHHHNYCPVARFYAAVEAVRKQAQL